MSDGSLCEVGIKVANIFTGTICVDCGKGHCDRWNHLYERIFTVKMMYGVAVVGVGDEVPRCACGGMFHPAPAGDGTMLCDCCGAAWDYEFGGPKPMANVPESEVGRTLTEVLLARRRPSTTWSPTDDDVKVTVHA